MIRLYFAGVGVTVLTGAVFSFAFRHARLGVAWWTVLAVVVMASLVVLVLSAPCGQAPLAGDDGRDDDAPVDPQPSPGGVDVIAEVEALLGNLSPHERV